VYVLNNPILLVDPSGNISLGEVLWPLIVVGAIVFLVWFFLRYLKEKKVSGESPGSELSQKEKQELLDAAADVRTALNDKGPCGKKYQKARDYLRDNPPGSVIAAIREPSETILKCYRECSKLSYADQVGYTCGDNSPETGVSFGPTE
jgi:hypothetical protein